MREEFRALRQDMNGLSRLVERVIFEVQKDREAAARDRENLVLRLENALLRSGKSLPPKDSDQDT